MENKIEYMLGTIAGITCRGSVTAMVYNLKDQNVTIYYDVIPVDADGNEISEGVISRYGTSNVADNSTLVNAADGSFADTSAPDYKYDAATMIGQYDFFVSIAQNVPVKVNDLLQQYLISASKMNSWGKK